LRPRVQHAPRLGRSSAGPGERTEDLDACVDASQLHEAARDDEVDIGIPALLFRTCASQPGASRRAFPLELLSSMLEPTGLLPTVGRPVRRPLSAKQARRQILHTFVQHACRSSTSVPQVCSNVCVPPRAYGCAHHLAMLFLNALLITALLLSELLPEPRRGWLAVCCRRVGGPLLDAKVCLRSVLAIFTYCLYLLVAGVQTCCLYLLVAGVQTCCLHLLVAGGADVLPVLACYWGADVLPLLACCWGVEVLKSPMQNAPQGPHAAACALPGRCVDAACAAVSRAIYSIWCLRCALACAR
jgi:hypothetical protein